MARRFGEAAGFGDPHKGLHAQKAVHIPSYDTQVEGGYSILEDDATIDLRPRIGEKAMWNLDENTITTEVLGRLQDAGNPRLLQIMSALIQHLHDFAREVALTEEEWFAGVRFLTDVGHITDDKRQEFVLLSDTCLLYTSDAADE